MADVVLKIDADTARYIAKIAQAAEQTKKIGDAAGRSVGTSLESSMTRALLRVETLKKVLRTVAQMADDIGRRATDASKSAGERRVSLATSLGSLGVKDVSGVIKDVEKQSFGSVASVDQVTSFAESLASASEGQRAPIDSKTATEALAAYRAGGDILYGKGGSEITRGLERGLSIEEITKQARARRPGLDNLGGDVSRELAVRGVENNYRLAAEGNRSERGDVQRLGAARTDFRASQGIGAEAAYTFAENNGGLTPTNAVNGEKMADTLALEIRAQTKQLMAAGQLNLSGQGEQGR